MEKKQNKLVNYNKNGFVDLADFTIWKQAYLKVSPQQ